MFPKAIIKTYNIKSDFLNISILESGSLCEIRDGIVRINTYIGNNLEPTISNIYLRIERDNKYYYTRLLGTGSPSSFTVENNSVIYVGRFMEVVYEVKLILLDDTFYYKVKMNSDIKDITVSLFYGLDVSINNIYAIRNNEAYVSQYVDHKAFKRNNGYILCSRQNMDNPYYLEIGSFNETIAYCTDGFQFFGKTYKETNVPMALLKEKLESKNYQYEFSYQVLQTKKILLDTSKEVVFYTCYKRNHEECITKPLYYDYSIKLLNKYKEEKKSLNYQRLDYTISFEKVLTGLDLTNDEIKKLYPKRTHIEKKTGLLSFFLPNNNHVVLKKKELLLERPSGNIIYSQNKINNRFDFENVMASTCYMYGVFNSQIVCGNCSFNKLMSNQRNPLNLQKITGQRIFIKIDNEYHLLTLTSCFEMSLNGIKWFYKLKDDYLLISSIVSHDQSKISLSFKSLKNISYDIIVTNQLTMAQNENESLVHVKQNGQTISFFFDKDSMAYSKYPDLFFNMTIDVPFKMKDDAIFYKDNMSRNDNIVSLIIHEKVFNITIYSNKEDSSTLDYIKEEKNYLNEMLDFTNHFEVKTDDEELSSYNHLILWFAHDALVHYLSPHGLEQYNGAAWGTRDLCQGPAELFLGFQKYDEVRFILLSVYKHQYLENGKFPQWFMFDRFFNIQDTSSHGDIIVWPARLLALYLEETKDYTILTEKVPYTSLNGIIYTEKEYTILEHLDKEIEYITKHFYDGTHLSLYSGGDWDDTLQPANKSFQDEMVSGWTPSLTYEMFDRLGRIIQDFDSKRASDYQLLASKIKIDYEKYLIKDEIPTGFIHFHGNETNYIIHPSDSVTKIKYRLLPLTRGIISGLFNEEKSRKMLQVIENNLSFPDGVRLMNNTVPYSGGIKTYFNRAETAANFGREIGLQYCHAHIRYCESLKRIGDGEKLYQNLQKINPIIVTDMVKNAEIRQRNSYFSSSDGNFYNRYEAMKDFAKLKSGKIKVKGGWRVYSSGSGIYIHNMIRGLLGISRFENALLFEPLYFKKVIGCTILYRVNDKDISIKYHYGLDNRVLLNDKVVFQSEDKISCIIPLDYITDKCQIDVYFKREITYDEKKLIEEEMKSSFNYFWNESLNGLTLDKCYENKTSQIVSTAAIGFALSAYVIGIKRGYITKSEGEAKVKETLLTLNKIHTFHGFYPHFLYNNLSVKQPNTEFSTIDTTILFMGLIICGSYFKDTILDEVNKMINNLDFDIFIREKDKKYYLNMAYSEYFWKDNNGYCYANWDHYAEELMMYFLYAGRDSVDQDLALKLYNDFDRNIGEYKDWKLVYCYSNPLFIHQFSHAFIPLQKYYNNDDIDWFNNSVKATLANREYCINQKWSKTYNVNSWGLTAFMGENNYQVFGAPPFGFPNKPYVQKIDGSVAPYASLSSICFTPNESISALKYMNTIPNIKGKYGYYDSYNFEKKTFISDTYIGIDKGLTLIMLDNYLYGTIWKYMEESMFFKKAMKVLKYQKIN